MTTAHRLLNLRFPTLDAQSQEFQKTEINWPVGFVCIVNFINNLNIYKILADKSRLTSEETDILIDFANRENWKSIRETVGSYNIL